MTRTYVLTITADDTEGGDRVTTQTLMRNRLGRVALKLAKFESVRSAYATVTPTDKDAPRLHVPHRRPGGLTCPTPRR